MGQRDAFDGVDVRDSYSDDEDRNLLVISIRSVCPHIPSRGAISMDVYILYIPKQLVYIRSSMYRHCRQKRSAGLRTPFREHLHQHQPRMQNEAITFYERICFTYLLVRQRD